MSFRVHRLQPAVDHAQCRRLGCKPQRHPARMRFDVGVCTPTYSDLKP